MPLRLDVDHVLVRTEAERHQIERVAPTVEAAFRELAARLDRTPIGREGDVRERVVAALDIEAVSLDELLSPRGAARLADAWYRQLVKARP